MSLQTPSQKHPKTYRNKSTSSTVNCPKNTQKTPRTSTRAPHQNTTVTLRTAPETIIVTHENNPPRTREQIRHGAVYCLEKRFRPRPGAHTQSPTVALQTASKNNPHKAPKRPKTPPKKISPYEHSNLP